MADSISTYKAPISSRAISEENIQHFRSTPEGARAYKRTLAFLLAAVGKKQNISSLAVEETVGASFLVNCSAGVDVERLLQGMVELIGECLAVERKVIDREEAIGMFEKQNQPKTARLVYYTPDVAVSCYSVTLGKDGEFITLQHGALLPHLGLLDKTLISLERVDENTLQLFYPQLNIATDTFELARSPEPKLMEAYVKQKNWAAKLNFQTVTDVNQAITRSEGNVIVQLSESLHEFQIVDIATKIGGSPGVNSHEPRPRLVLIAGPSSSGKTTFAKRLGVSLQTLGLKPIVLSVDSYYKDWQHIDPRGMEYVDWESLDSLNLELLNDHLLALLSGEEVLVPEYDMRTSTTKSKEHWISTRLPPGGLIVMEGIHCLNPRLTPKVKKADKFHIMISPLSALALDEMTFVSSTQVRMLRRLVRDYLFRGRTAESTLKQWSGVARGERLNIYPNQNNADVVMNSGLLFEVNVLKIYAEPLLQTILPSQDVFPEATRLLKMLSRFVSLPGNVVPPQSLLREFIGGSWFYEYGGWYKTA